MKRLLLYTAFLSLLALVLCGCLYPSPDDYRFRDQALVYTGEPLALTCEIPPTDGVSVRYENNVHTEAGVYEATASFYYDKTGDLIGTRTATLTIEKAHYDLSGVSFPDRTVTYDGSSHALKLEGVLPEGVSVTYDHNSFTDAGSYRIRASFTGDTKNYHPIPSMEAVLTIEKATPRVTLTCTDTYLTTAMRPNLTADLAGEILFSHDLRIGTHTYTCSFLPTDSNYHAVEELPITLTVYATVRYMDGEDLCKEELLLPVGTLTPPTRKPYVRDGYRYIFSHWSQSEGGAAFDTETPISDDLTLHAVYRTEAQEFLLLQEPNGEQTQFVYYPSELPVALPQSSDPLFLGYYRAPRYSAERVTQWKKEDQSQGPLYALYLPKVTLTSQESIVTASYRDRESAALKASSRGVGALAEIGCDSPASTALSDTLMSVYGYSRYLKLANASLQLQEEAIAALASLCQDYYAAYGTVPYLIASAYTANATQDAAGGYSFVLRYVSEDGTVSPLTAPEAQHARTYLETHAASYGIVLRYPKEKASLFAVEGEANEALYRYVGVPHAEFMTRHALCLEEYLQYLRSLTGKQLTVTHDDTTYTIEYIPSSSAAAAKLPVEKEFTLSGDNRLGWILTVKEVHRARELDILLTLDAGHGGVDSGALDPSGTYHESDITLAVIQYLKAECEAQGFQVLLTRSNDSYLSLGERCDIANKAKSDLFVSVHCNSHDTATPSGTEVYYAYGEKSTRLANDIYDRMIAAVPLTPRGVKSYNYYVITYTEMPAVLCELAFLSNASDLSKLISPEYQKKWAEGICRGICDFYDIPYLETVK